MINSFKDEYRFLSNFWLAKVWLDGEEYKSVEHGYVAAKTLNPVMRFEIQSIPMPGQVKDFGKSLELRPDWDSVKLGIMENLVRQKFSNPLLMQLLQDTGDQEIIEGNWWHDNFWGSCTCDSCMDRGQNNLGKILMRIRDDKQLRLPFE